MANGAARQVVRHVIVCGNAGPIAYPEVRQRLEIAKFDVVFGAETRQTSINARRADVIRRRIINIFIIENFGKHLVELDHATVEIETGKIVVVKEPASDLRRSTTDANRCIGIILKQVLHGRRRGLLTRFNERPVGNRLLEHNGLGRRQELARNRVCPYPMYLSDIAINL